MQDLCEIYTLMLSLTQVLEHLQAELFLMGCQLLLVTEGGDDSYPLSTEIAKSVPNRDFVVC